MHRTPSLALCITLVQALSAVVPAQAQPGTLKSHQQISETERGWAGEGNIDADPLIVDPGSWEDNGIPEMPEDDYVEVDYHLSAGLPCIDVVDRTAVPPDTTDLDDYGDTDEPIPFGLDGNLRFVYGTERLSYRIESGKLVGSRSGLYGNLEIVLVRRGVPPIPTPNPLRVTQLMAVPAPST